MRSVWWVAIASLALTIAIVVLALVSFSNLFELGFEGLFDGLGSQLVILVRVLGEDEPDLLVQPGEPGYFPYLQTQGPQLHYHCTETDETTIAGDVLIGRETLRWAVARYRGEPSVRVQPMAIRELIVPAILVVRCVDEDGRPVAGVNVRIERSEGGVHQSQSGLTAAFCGDSDSIYSSCERGEARFVLFEEGTWRVHSGDGDAHRITVGAREYVSCTIGPRNRIAVERANPRVALGD